MLGVVGQQSCGPLLLSLPPLLICFCSNNCRFQLVVSAWKVLPAEPPFDPHPGSRILKFLVIVPLFCLNHHCFDLNSYKDGTLYQSLFLQNILR